MTNYADDVKNDYFVGVDFDDTVVVAAENYPGILGDIPNAAHVLRAFARMGMKILLVTCREGDDLAVCERWFTENKIPLAGVNVNPEKFWEGHRKIFAHASIDDRNVGVPTRWCSEQNKVIVDWLEIYKRVVTKYMEWLIHE